jgi:putative transcriptional regulator
MNRAPMTVMETPSFLRDAKRLMDDDERDEIVSNLQAERGAEMSGARIVESMKEALAIAQGAMPEDAYTVHLPTAVDVKGIRTRMGLSQPGFAARFGLSLHALRNWEQGKRKPDPAARAYLRVIEKYPDTVRAALSGG